MQTTNKILVPVDFSAEARAAVDRAAVLAQQLGASLDVLYVLESGETLSASRLGAFARSEAGQEMARILEDLEECGLGERVHGRLMAGDPAAAIVEAAEGYDMVVIGTSPRRGLRRLIAGSVGERVAREAACPVLTVRRAEQGPAPPRRHRAGPTLETGMR